MGKGGTARNAGPSPVYTGPQAIAAKLPKAVAAMAAIFGTAPATAAGKASSRQQESFERLLGWERMLGVHSHGSCGSGTPTQMACSVNLQNPAHLDVHDGSESFATRDSETEIPQVQQDLGSEGIGPVGVFLSHTLHRYSI